MAGKGNPPFATAFRDMAVKEHWRMEAKSTAEVIRRIPADKTGFKDLFDNQDAGTPHDIDILQASGTKVFDGKDFPGVAQKTYHPMARLRIVLTDGTMLDSGDEQSRNAFRASHNNTVESFPMLHNIARFSNLLNASRII